MSAAPGGPFACVRRDGHHLEQPDGPDARRPVLQVMEGSSKATAPPATRRLLWAAWSFCVAVCAAHVLYAVITRFVPPPGFSTPPVVTYAHLVKTWTMFGNDHLGDCTVAAEGELIEVFDAVAHRPVDLGRLDDAVLSRWRSVRSTPYLYTTTSYWRADPIVGVRPVAWRDFSVRRRRDLELAVQELGAIEVAITLPTSFRRPPPGVSNWPPKLWTLGDFDGSPRFGHAAVVVGFGRTGVILATWGHTVDVTWGWLDRYGRTAEALLPSIYERTGHGPVNSVATIRRTVFDER
jgi:hypothetical protein